MPGIVRARRYRFDSSTSRSNPTTPPYEYLAVYEVPEGYMQVARDALEAASVQRRQTIADGGTALIPSSPAMADGYSSFWFSAVGDQIEVPLDG